MQGGRWGGWTHYEMGKGFVRLNTLKAGEDWQRSERARKLVSLLLSYGVPSEEISLMQTRGYAADNNIFTAYSYLKFHIDSARRSRSYFYASCARIHLLNIACPLAAITGDGTDGMDMPHARNTLNMLRKYSAQRFADYFIKVVSEKTDLQGVLPC